MTAARRMTRFDRLVLCLERLHPVRRESTLNRPNPAGTDAATNLPAEQRRCSARLMRVNHSGELCAQALYVGQAAFARDGRVASALQQAADEEIEHLHWCQQRLRELGAQPSRLNPFWLAGSLASGALASLAGDRWSLGFLAETERQVVRHLEEHLRRLPAADGPSRAIVAAMRDDEARHATTALAHGAADLPRWLCELMRVAASVMTSVASRI